MSDPQKSDHNVNYPPGLTPSSKHLMSPAWKHNVKKYRTEIAAGTSSLVSTLSAYPFDTLKTRIQTYHYPTVWSCIKDTYAKEGAHGFWRGCLAPLGSITFVRTISFTVYQHSKYLYDGFIQRVTGESPLVRANTKGALPSPATVACFGAAGATSGALITAIACPFELCKTASQLSVLIRDGNRITSMTDPLDVPKRSKQDYSNKGTFRIAQALVRERGLLGLYCGGSYHLLRDTIGTCIYFTTYETAKQLMSNSRGNSPTSPGAVFLAGGLCGLASWSVIYPIDSAKQIYQKNCLSSKPEHTARQKIEFFNRRMYRGLGVSMLRSCIVNSIFFSSFELIKKQINRIEIGPE